MIEEGEGNEMEASATSISHTEKVEGSARQR